MSYFRTSQFISVFMPSCFPNLGVVVENCKIYTSPKHKISQLASKYLATGFNTNVKSHCSMMKQYWKNLATINVLITVRAVCIYYVFTVCFQVTYYVFQQFLT